MTRGKQVGRKTKGAVRTPATKYAHLRKRMEARRYGARPSRGRGG